MIEAATTRIVTKITVLAGRKPYDLSGKLGLMLEWLGTGLGMLLVIAGAAWQLYQWQRKQDAVRIVSAIRAQDSRELSALLAERADFKSVGKWFGNPAVIVAVTSPSAGFTPEALKLLLKHGADINEAGTEWKTALMHAAAGGHRELCELLLSHGADPKARDLFGRTATYWAERCGDWRIIALLP